MEQASAQETAENMRQNNRIQKKLRIGQQKNGMITRNIIAIRLKRLIFDMVRYT